jgi:hypothetical protein
MRFSAVLCIVGAVGLAPIGFTRGGAQVSEAQVLPESPSVQMFTDMFDTHSNETGFTLGEVLDRKMWALARHPLASEALSRVGDDAHRAPHRGVQVELLTPGDIGVTVHFRW